MARSEGRGRRSRERRRLSQVMRSDRLEVATAAARQLSCTLQSVAGCSVETAGHSECAGIDCASLSRTRLTSSGLEALLDALRLAMTQATGGVPWTRSSTIHNKYVHDTNPRPTLAV